MTGFVSGFKKQSESQKSLEIENEKKEDILPFLTAVSASNLDKTIVAIGSASTTATRTSMIHNKIQCLLPVNSYLQLHNPTSNVHPQSMLASVEPFSVSYLELSYCDLNQTSQ